VLVVVRVSSLGWARPLPIPSRGRDGGEVMCLSSTVQLRHEEGVMANPSLSFRPSLLGLAGPRSFGLSLTGVLRASWLAN
jgi:hypothetical protein